jgi:hypothetical protein
MAVWLVCGVTLFAVLASAQTKDIVPAKSGPADLVPPRPGVPLSLEQVEERSYEGAGSTAEIIKSNVYRDSSGRLRIEPEARDGSGDPSSHATLIDPFAGTRIILLPTAKTAYRVLGPKGDEGGFALGLGGMGEGLEPPHKWSTRTENLGTRIIEGAVFEGTRIIEVAEDESGLTNTIERWYSKELNIVGVAVASGPYGTHTARIENLHRQEPDPTLFTIPADYKILELQSPKAPQWTVGAKSAYQDFLGLWKDADPDIPILKQAKAEYAKRVLSSAPSGRVEVPLAPKW